MGFVIQSSLKHFLRPRLDRRASKRRALAVCTRCSANSGHLLSAQTSNVCVCNAVYTGEDGETCSACPVSKYKPANYWPRGVNVPELTTPANSGHALTAQAVAAACLCNPEHTGAKGGNCTACEEGTYKPASGSGACAIYPGNSTSLPSSVNSSVCVCNAGFGGPAAPPAARARSARGRTSSAARSCVPPTASPRPACGARRTACRPGHYALGPTVRERELQRVHRGKNFNTTSPASQSSAACLCLPGYYSFPTLFVSCISFNSKVVLHRVHRELRLSAGLDQRRDLRLPPQLPQERRQRYLRPHVRGGLRGGQGCTPCPPNPEEFEL